MQEYSFVSIAIVRRREGASFERDYREVIREKAKDGWVFVQAIRLGDHAEPRLDLVFTRKVRDKK